MTDVSYDTIRAEIFTELKGHDVTDEAYLTAIKALEGINKAEVAQKTEESKGAKAWFDRHSDALIKVGGSAGIVVLIGIVETKFDVIFRSKAAKYL